MNALVTSGEPGLSLQFVQDEVVPGKNRPPTDKEQTAKKEKENQLIQAALKNGKFVVNFSFRREKDGDDDSSHVGWKTIQSKRWAKRLAFEANLHEGEELAAMFPQNHIPDRKRSKLFNKLAERGGPPILEAVSIKPIYRPETRERTSVGQVTKGGFLGVKFAERKEVTTKTFIRNKPEFIDLPGGGRRLAAQIVYSTLAHHNDNSHLYKDPNTRPGNRLLFKIKVPIELAKVIANKINEDPTFIRRLVEQALVDGGEGLETQLIEGGRQLVFSKDQDGRVADLPQFDSWPDSRMVVHKEGWRIPDHDTSEDPPKELDEMVEEILENCVVVN